MTGLRAALGPDGIPGLRAALGTDGIPGMLALLVLLLLAMLVAVFRLPPWTPQGREEDEQSLQVPAATDRPAPVPHAPHAPPVPHYPHPPPAPPAPHDPDAARRPGQTGYRARHGPGHPPGTDDPPKVTGSPPWGPAPRPPGLRP